MLIYIESELAIKRKVRTRLKNGKHSQGRLKSQEV